MFDEWTAELVAPQHGFSQQLLMVVPEEPHAGPYGDEAYALASAAGLEPAQLFATAEFEPPSGLALIVNVVPGEGAPGGSSFDFECGLVIPPDAFPIGVTGDLLREGAVYDSELESEYLAPAGDGISHFFMVWGTNSAFGPPEVG
jgi:hypothetical protein